MGIMLAERLGWRGVGAVNVGPKIVVVDVVREWVGKGEEVEVGLGSQEGRKQYPGGISTRGPSDMLLDESLVFLVKELRSLSVVATRSICFACRLWSR